MKKRFFFRALLVAAACWIGCLAGQSSPKDHPAAAPVESLSRKPLIGIASLTDSNYVRAVRDSGAVPVILPNTGGSTAMIDEYLTKLDGLLLPGGADIPPSEWNEEPHATTKVLDDDRYHFEKALVSAWIKRTKKPLLGICLGSQWINVAHGGSLVQDIPSEFNTNHRGTTHPVTLEADSKLAGILGETTFEVNSFHHQAVRRLGAGLRIVARSPEGIVEATETTDPSRFLIGVQWHPEKMFLADPRQQKLFKAFIDAAAITASGAGDDAAKKKASANAAITIAPGGLPIILTAPHGGRAALPGVEERKGDGANRFNPRTDSNTDILTEKLADSLEQKLGKRPYVVMARFHRKYIDANRPPQDAFESPEAKSTYAAYHAAIDSACKEVTARWGRGVVLDIHGQAAQPGAVLRGTQNGKTVTHLLKQSGREAVYGETSLFGQLAKQGFAVFPPVGSNDPESPNYTGGYTVGTHGSSSGGTIDAIQLELGSQYRDSKAIENSAEKLASAITAFAKSYLPAEEQKPVAGDASKRTGKIAVGVYLDKGAGPSANDLLRVLGKFDKVSVTKLTAEQIRSGGLAGLDILMHPGGSGGDQGRNLDEPGREKIRGFVREGGGFIGICAGAYLASAHYPWSLNLLDAKVIDTTHWNRGIGTVDIELTPAGREILRTTNQKFPIHYAQGPLLAPAGRPEIEDYEEMASFKTEIAKNGAPEGMMIGTTAIARGRFGQGRVICFSPHPEMTAGVEAFVQDAIDYVNRKRAAQ